MIKIFTIPFSKQNETFFEDDLNRFLLNKRAKTVKAEFFKSRENFYWTVFIDYDTVIHEKEKGGREGDSQKKCGIAGKKFRKVLLND